MWYMVYSLNLQIKYKLLWAPPHLNGGNLSLWLLFLWNYTRNWVSLVLVGTKETLITSPWCCLLNYRSCYVVLALGQPPGSGGSSGRRLLPTEYSGPYHLLCCQCPPSRGVLWFWSDMCKKGLSLYHAWTPHPLKHSDPKEKTFPS